MIRPNQLYINKVHKYHIVVKSETMLSYGREAVLVETNGNIITGRGPLSLATASIERSFTLIANNYQPK